MLNALTETLNVQPLVPHGYCYLWKTGLIGLHLTADTLIVLAYYSIPIALFYFVHQRKDLPFKWVFLLFAAFIIACGTTHLLEIWTLWYPAYWLSGGAKAITALISVVAALKLVPLIPRALELPRPAELQRLNEELQASQARISGILAGASDAIISIDTEWRITLFNRAAEQMFGYSVADILGQPLGQLLLLSEVAFPLAFSGKGEQTYGITGSGDRWEMWGRRQDGTLFAIEASRSEPGAGEEESLTLFLRDISDRKKAEAELQEQQQFLRQVIDANPNLIFVKDWDGRFVLVNQAVADIYNTTVEDLIGKTDADFSSDPIAAQEAMQAELQALRVLQPLLKIEETCLTVAGSVHYLQTIKKPLVFADGQARYLLGVANDITALKQTEAALQQKTEDLEGFFSGTIDLWCIASHDGYFLRLNPEWEQTLGYPLETLEGKRFLDFVHQDDLDATRLAMKQLAEQKAILSFTNRYRHRDGSYRWLEWRSVPNAHCIYATARDITERRQTEAALRESEERFRSAFDYSAIGMALVALDGRWLKVNSALCEIVGYSEEELCTLTFQDLTYVDDLEPDLALVQQLLAGKIRSYQMEKRYVHKQGHIVWIHLSSSLVRNSQNEPQYFISQIQDITHRKQAEAALQHSESTLRSFFNSGAMMMGIVELYDNDVRHLSDNVTSAQFFGTTPDRLKNQLATVLGVQRSHLDLWIGHYREALRTQAPVRFEYLHATSTTPVWLAATVCPIETTPNGSPRLSYMVEDITERKHAEVRLRQSEITQRAILQAIPDLLIRMRQDGTLLELINSSYVHFILPQMAVVGANIADILPPDVTQERLRCAAQALATGEVQLHEYQLTIDGQCCYEEARTVPLQADEVLIMIRDITDRKQMEQALQESETRFRSLIEDLQVGVIVHGVYAEILLSNSKAPELLGLTEAQLLGKTSFDPDWNVIHEDGSPFPGPMHPVPQAIATGRSVRNVIMGVYRPRHQDWVWLLVDAEPQLDAAGNVKQVVCTFSDISDRQAALREREKAKAELQQREQEFRALVEHAPDIIMRLDYDCRYLYINPTVERHSGVPAAAFLNKTIEEFGASESLIDLWRTNIHKAFETGEEQKLEFETVTSTGTAYYATRIVPELASDGSVQSVLAIARDISDYVRSLHERERAEERLQLALKAAKFGTWEYNFVTGELFQTNLSELYGLNPGQTHQTYDDWQSQVHPSDRDWVQAEFEQAVQAGGEFYAEFRIVRPDETIRWTVSTGAVVHSPTGQPLYAYGMATDITDRKLAEVEQKAQQAFLRQVIDTVPNIIFVKNKSGRFLIVNQAGADAHGTTVEEMLGKRETDFNPNFSSEQLKALLAINRQVMQTRQSHVDLSQMTIQATGETRWYQTVINPLIDVHGQITGVVGATTDVTTLKQAEQVLQQAKENAESASKAKSIFLANMSHELRTPLNVILGFAQVMHRDPLLTAEQREHLQIIRRSGDHLLSLINDVLDLSKIEAGHITLDKSRVDFLDLLKSLEKMLFQRAAAKCLQLRLELAPDLPQYILIDANKLRQVLINLLGNAIKFTQQGEVVLRVRTAEWCNLSLATPPQFGLHFEVHDTGVGIAPAELDAIFSAFVQTQVGKVSPDGTGLGLTISRKFVQMMGGDITVQSVLGHGSTFAFTIPVQVVDAVERAIAPFNCQVIGLAPNQPIYRILVVDDQPENRKLLVKLLTQIGLEVREATNGAEAVAQWQTWHPHLIYMDIRMPLLNGYEATQQIRATSEGQQPIIIALTAQASSSDRTLAIASGCNDYLSKPFQEEMLLSQMAQYLGLQYRYAAEPSPAGIGTFRDTVITLQPSDLQVMPSDWIAELRHTAQLCDDGGIEQLIQQIPPEQTTLIQGLRQLIQNYSFKQIIVLTRPEATQEE